MSERSIYIEKFFLWFMLVRVQKILAERGLASRRKCEELIRIGKVKVNGKLIKLGDQADPEKDKITVEDKPIPFSPQKIYLVLNKPWGFVTTVSEMHGMKTVMELLPVKEKLYPVGRLDRYSDGLLLLTNDGELAHKLTHPSFGVSKEYIAKLDKPTTPEKLEKILEMRIDGREVAIEAIVQEGENRVRLRIHEGRKHIVRRIFEELGYQVKKLTRTKFGPLVLGELKVGQWRYLNDKEVEALKKATNLKTK